MNTNESTARAFPSDAALQHEQEALALYKLIAEGRSGSDEAETLRDTMAESWDAMTASEQILLRGLYRDLHMLTGNEVLDPDPIDFAELKRSVMQGEREVALALLRKRRDALALSHVAYFRARCWNDLYFRHAALAFMDHAASLNPTNANYTYLVFHMLLDLGKVQESLDKAINLESRADAKSQALFGAAHALFQAARAGVRNAPDTYERVTKLLDRSILLESERPDETRMTSLIVQGYLELGLCHEFHDDFPRAIQCYTNALLHDPDDDTAHVARGLARLDTEPREAERDFERAVYLDTPSIWPYLMLAHQRLVRGEYRACLNICEKALPRTTVAEHLANLYEWMAIAHACIPSTSSRVEGFFLHAIELDPLNERIRNNLAIYRSTYGPGALNRHLAPPPWKVENDVSPTDARLSHQRCVFDRAQRLLTAA